VGARQSEAPQPRVQDSAAVVAEHALNDGNDAGAQYQLTDPCEEKDGHDGQSTGGEGEIKRNEQPKAAFMQHFYESPFESGASG